MSLSSIVNSNDSDHFLLLFLPCYTVAIKSSSTVTFNRRMTMIIIIPVNPGNTGDLTGMI